MLDSASTSAPDAGEAVPTSRPQPLEAAARAESFLRGIGGQDCESEAELRQGLRIFSAFGQELPKVAMGWINRLASATRSGHAPCGLAATCAGLACLGIVESQKWSLPVFLSVEVESEYDDEGGVDKSFWKRFDWESGALQAVARRLGGFTPQALELLRAFFEMAACDWGENGWSSGDEDEIESAVFEFAEDLPSRPITEWEIYGVDRDEASLAAMAETLGAAALEDDLRSHLALGSAREERGRI